MSFEPAFAERELFEHSYAELSEEADRWIRQVESTQPVRDRDAVDARHREIDRIGQLLRRRGIARFRDRVGARSRLHRAFTELFLLSRIRTYVLAYLSVQEGEDFEGRDEYETPVPRFIQRTLRDLGRRSNFGIEFRFLRIRLTLNLDPLRHLRSIYADCVRRGRPGPVRRMTRFLASRYHCFLFRLKTTLFSIALGTFYRMVRRRDSDAVRAFLRSRTFQRHVRRHLPALFLEAERFTPEQWDDLAERIASYFPPRLTALFDSMPQHSVASHGLIKLFKVAFGVIAGRTSTRDAHEAGGVDFVFNTLRLAYCWGVTYPLVDNVLDSSATSPGLRHELSQRLTRLFAGDDFDEPAVLASPDVRGVVEVEQRLRESLKLVDANRLPRIQRTLLHLYQAHQRDAERRLSTVDPTHLPVVWRDVMIDTALKSALVRLATMELCAISVDSATCHRSLVRSLFNQLGDDLWDIYEDAGDDRVTPFTLFLNYPTLPNPFAFYLDYSMLLARDQSARRRTAVFLGFCETLRDALETIRSRPTDNLGVSRRIVDLLEESARVAQKDFELLVVPHVDFDAVLFLFEDALLELMRD